MYAFAATAIVCGAWFHGLPAGWHQSLPSAVLLRDGVTEENTISWAANFQPSPLYGIGRGFPRDGVYVWFNLARPERGLARRPLRLPLRLVDASTLRLEGSPNLPEYRFDGRFRQQYWVLGGVDFGRPHPTRRMRRAAERALRALVLPRWLPRPSPCRG